MPYEGWRRGSAATPTPLPSPDCSGPRCPYADSPGSNCTKRAKPVMSSMRPISAAGVRMVSVPPVTSSRSAPRAITASPDASMKRSAARSNTTDRWPRSIIVSKKAPNSGALRTSTSPWRARITCPSTKLAATEKSASAPVAAVMRACPEDPRGGTKGALPRLRLDGQARVDQCRWAEGENAQRGWWSDAQRPTVRCSTRGRLLQGVRGSSRPTLSCPLCRRCFHRTPASTLARRTPSWPTLSTRPRVGDHLRSAREAIMTACGTYEMHRGASTVGGWERR